MAAGVTCLADGATVLGPVEVQSGAGLVATGAAVLGRVTASVASVVQLIGTTAVGPVSITGTTARVAIVDSRFVGPVSLTGNVTGTTPVVLSASTVIGSLACSGNQPAPANGGRPNAVVGRATGQCAGL